MRSQASQGVRDGLRCFVYVYVIVPSGQDKSQYRTRGMIRRPELKHRPDVPAPQFLAGGLRHSRVGESDGLDGEKMVRRQSDPLSGQAMLKVADALEQTTP